MAEQILISFCADKALNLTDTIITRSEFKKAFYDLRSQAADIPEMSLDEINAEISAARAERKR